jgi:hypothetical protein
MEDGIANVAKITSDNVTLNIREARSIGRYGQSRTVELSLTGLPLALSNLRVTYAQFAQAVLSRVLYQWSQPIAMVRVPVSLDWIDRCSIGDFLGLSEDMLPDGAGGRGLGNATALAALGISTQVGQLIGREINIKDGIIWLELLLMPVSCAYAPCVRVKESPTTTTIVADTAYIMGAGDYTDSTSLADGGARKFSVGMPCKLVQIDSAAGGISGTLTIQSIATDTIEFTSAIDPTIRTDIAGGGKWNLVFYDYGDGSAVTSDQAGYAWVGSLANNVIGTSSRKPQEWAP